jgi:hypothetical protein
MVLPSLTVPCGRWTAQAFKIIPKLSNWEEVLFITEPENWSVHACYQARTPDL